MRGVGRIKAIHLHVFADPSNIACSAVTIAVVEGETGVVKGLLTSKSRVSKRNTSIARLYNRVDRQWSPCIGSEIRENLGKFSYQTKSRRWRKLPARQGSPGGIVQHRRIWQTWEAEELEFTRWRPEGGLQVLNGY